MSSWMLDLPWGKNTPDNLDLKRARRILAEDHYGLDEVKQRIIEYLAVCRIKNNMKGPVLCFVGPPGVGKTSIAKSITRALGRKFVQMSLGGVRDEAEIRGHRRTYIGAIPGRIVSSIKQAGTMNPASCWMKSTRWRPMCVVIRRARCSRCWTAHRTTLSAITIWKHRSTCPA